MVSIVFPTVHAAPTLTIFPSSVTTNQGTAASYIVNLNGGTPNASYALTVTGLPAGSIYSFSSTSIAPSDSSVLTIQTSIPSPLYCPLGYSFIVTATNTLLSSDSASATGTLGVKQVGPSLIVSLSTDKSTYMVGEIVTISIVNNRPAEGTLTISPPSGSPQTYQYGYTGSPMKILTATLPGTWTAALAADDYCGVSSTAVAHFDVASSTTSSTNTTSTNTTTFTVTSASTSSYLTITVTSATSTTISTSVTTETGTVAINSVLTATAVTQWTASALTTLAQSSTTSTVIIWNIQNPMLELVLGSILTIALLTIAISLIRRPRYGNAITCGNCGFKNPFTASTFCIKCGQPLKGGQPA